MLHLSIKVMIFKYFEVEFAKPAVFSFNSISDTFQPSCKERWKNGHLDTFLR